MLNAVEIQRLTTGISDTAVIQPVLIFRHEGLLIGILADVAALICLAQQFQAVFAHFAIIHPLRVGTEVHAVALLSGQDALFDQIFQIDQIGVARDGGKGLIGGSAVAGGAQGQDLPVGLACLDQSVHKIISRPGETANAILGRQTGDGQQNTGTSHHNILPYQM